MDTPASLLDQHAWSLSAIVDLLRTRLAGPLPGLDSQRLMAPQPRAGWQPATVPSDARNAAALLLLYPRLWRPPEAPERISEVVHLALTRRASHLLNHSGQVALPGGAVERHETIERAALREATEEIGVIDSDVSILGELTPLHIPVSGFVLHPVVAFTLARPNFVPDVNEVARVIEAPLTVLCHASTVRLRIRHHEGRDYEVPYFLVDDEIVWGATAMVLAEFLATIGFPPFRPETVTDR